MILVVGGRGCSGGRGGNGVGDRDSSGGVVGGRGSGSGSSGDGDGGGCRGWEGGGRKGTGGVK